MKADDPRWRIIVRHDRHFVEKSSYRGNSFSWKRSEVHTLTLECGHTQIRHGYGCPTTKVLCKDCVAGKPRVEVTVKHGYFDHGCGAKVEDPIARALIANAGGGHLGETN